VKKRKKAAKRSRRFTEARAEILAVERLVGTGKLRPLPFHIWCRATIESGRASPELLAAAARSKKIWDEYSEEAGGRLR
jgi:hypothetical protein